jgi:mono/diheme cytochrome c family protein
VCCGMIEEKRIFCLRPGVSLAAVLSIQVCSVAWSAAPKSDDLASAARAVFAAKCTECHGADLAQPEGRFGYVLDLPRVAANPEMVITFSPDESELWELVRRDEMPPAGASAGPLSPREKETIRSWILAGAPAPAIRSPVSSSAAARPSHCPEPGRYGVRRRRALRDR